MVSITGMSFATNSWIECYVIWTSNISWGAKYIGSFVAGNPSLVRPHKKIKVRQVWEYETSSSVISVLVVNAVSVIVAELIVAAEVAVVMV